MIQEKFKNAATDFKIKKRLWTHKIYLKIFHLGSKIYRKERKKKKEIAVKIMRFRTTLCNPHITNVYTFTLFA